MRRRFPTLTAISTEPRGRAWASTKTCLIRAGVEEADVVAAVTQSDNSNLMVVEVARRIFHVPHVIARLYNPARERAYMQLGSTTYAARRLWPKRCFPNPVGTRQPSRHVRRFRNPALFARPFQHRQKPGEGVRTRAQPRHSHRAFDAATEAQAPFPRATACFTMATAFWRACVTTCWARFPNTCRWACKARARAPVGAGVSSTGGTMYIVIMGGGKVGNYLADVLLKQHHEVAVLRKRTGRRPTVYPWSCRASIE